MEEQATLPAKIQTLGHFIISEPTGKEPQAIFYRMVFFLLLEKDYKLQRDILVNKFEDVNERTMWNKISDARNMHLLVARKVNTDRMDARRSDTKQVELVQEALDVAHLQHLVQAIEASASDEILLELANQVIALYKGVFLPDEELQYLALEYYGLEVKKQRKKFAELYAYAIRSSLPVLLRKGQRDVAQSMVEQAIELHLPYPELVQIFHGLRLLIPLVSTQLPIAGNYVQQLRMLINMNRVVILCGEHKVGKTYLIQAMLRVQEQVYRLMGMRYMRYICVYQESACESFVRFYRSLFPGDKTNPCDNSKAAMQKCFSYLRRERIALILEDCHFLQPECEALASQDTKLWRMLIEQMRSEGSYCCIILVSLSTMTFTHVQNDNFMADIPILMLFGLSPIEGSMLLADIGVKNLAQEELERLSARFYGNPGLLRWIATQPQRWKETPFRAEDMREEAEQALTILLQENDDRERLHAILPHTNDAFSLILALALIRRPLSEQIIAVCVATHSHIIGSLRQHGYLMYACVEDKPDSTVSEAIYTIPCELRYYVLAEASSVEYTAAHKLVQQWYGALTIQSKGMAQERFMIEQAYHALCLGEITQVAQVLSHKSLLTGGRMALYAFRLYIPLYQTVSLYDPVLSASDSVILAYWLARGTQRVDFLEDERCQPNELTYYQIAWETARQAGLLELQARIGYRYSYAFYYKKDLVKAKKIADEALSLACRLDMGRITGLLYLEQAMISIYAQEFEEAEHYLHYFEAEYAKNQALAKDAPAWLRARSELCFVQGYYKEALEYVAQILHLVDQQRSRLYRKGYYYMHAAVICLHMGYLHAAEKLLVRSEKALKEKRHYFQHSRSFNLHRAHLAILRGQWQQAREELDNIGAYFELKRENEPSSQQQNISMEVREAVVWKTRHCVSSLADVPIDYRFFQQVSESLPLDATWLLGSSGPQWTTYEASLTATAFAQARNQERELFFRDQIEQPRIIHPRLIDFDLETIRAKLVEQRADVQHAFHPIIRQLYTETIDEGLARLAMLEAAMCGKSVKAQQIAIELYGKPDERQVQAALSHIFSCAYQCLHTPDLPEQAYQAARRLLQDSLTNTIVALPSSTIIPMGENMQRPATPATLDMALDIFRQGLAYYGLDDLEHGWSVEASNEVEAMCVHIQRRRILLPKFRTSWTLESIRTLFEYELECHVLRAEAGRRSRFRLLGIGLAGNLVAEEGLATRVRLADSDVLSLDDGRLTLVGIGLALGVLAPARTFRDIFSFLCDERFITFIQQSPQSDPEQLWRNAQEKAYRQCLRLFRGSLIADAPLWCYPKDLVYAEGSRQLAHLLRNKSEVARQALLKRLLVGRTSFRPTHLHALYELGYTEPALMTRHAWNDSAFLEQCELRQHYQLSGAKK